jgi:IclR family acetate operon transcriptional repressor
MAHRHFWTILAIRPSFLALPTGQIAVSGIGAMWADVTFVIQSGKPGILATPKNHSVMKAFSILKAFNDPDEWLTSCELSRRANLPGASGYRLILTLEEIGAIVRGPMGRFRPGLLLLSLSHNVTINELLRDASHALMTELTRILDLTMHLGVLEHGMVTYVAKVSNPGAFPVHTRVGAQLEPYCSGLGKVLLAALPDEEVERFILEGALVALTPYTITTAAALRSELNLVRKRGYALDDREHQANMRCIAVPVLDGEGRAVAALSATDDAERMTPERQVEIRDALFGAAAILRQKLYPTTSAPHRRGAVAAE